MKICVVAEVALNHYGWRRWREIVEKMALKNEVHLVAFCNDKHGKPLSSNVVKHLVDDKKIGRPKDTGKNTRLFRSKLLEVLEDRDFDFIFLCNPNRLSGKSVIAAKKETGISCMLDYGDFASAAELELGVIDKDEYKDRLELENRIIRNCDFFSVTNEVIRERIEKEGKGGDVFVKVPNGVNLSEFQNLEPDKVLSKYNLDNGKKKVIFSGTLNRSKGIHTFLRSLPQVEYDNFEAVITGERDLDKWKSLVEDENLNKNCTINFLGLIDREDIPSLFAACSVGTVPFEKSDFSRYSCPLKITEFYAAGLPVVASNIEGISELVEDGKTGFLIEPGDSDELAEKMTLILRDEELSGQLSKKSLEKVKSYDWQKLVSRLEKFLKSKL